VQSYKCSVLFISGFYTLFIVSSDLQHPFPLVCTIGHATAFAVNAALVVSLWQHCTWTVSLHPPINARQATSIILQVFGLVWNSLWQGWSTQSVTSLTKNPHTPTTIFIFECRLDDLPSLLSLWTALHCFRCLSYARAKPRAICFVGEKS